MQTDNIDNRDTALDILKSGNTNIRSYMSPKGDVLDYLYTRENPQYMDEPEDYGFTDWVSDAYTSWDIKRNETNYSTRMGDVTLLMQEAKVMEDAELYLANLNTISAAEGSDDPNVIAEAQKALILNEELLDTYMKVRSDYSLQGNSSQQLQQINSLKLDNYTKLQENIAEAAEYRNRVDEIISKSNMSDYYKHKENEGVFEYTLDSFMYKLPGIFGSSSASLKTQMLGMATGVAAGVITAGLTALTGGTAAIALAGLGATNLGLGLYGATEENKAEVFDNMKSRVQNEMLKNGHYEDVIKEARAKFNGEATDDQLMDKVLTGQIKINNEAFNKSLHEALTGVNSLYNRDMWKTFGTEALESVIEITPARGLLSPFKLVSNTVGKAVPKIGTAAQKLKNKIDDVTSFGIEKSLEGMSKRRVKNFVFDVVSDRLMLAANEMGEESVQYLNAQDYINKKYDGEDPFWLTSILDNTYGTAKSMYSFFAPWDTAMAKDEEWMDNSRAGFIMGLFNVGNILSTAGQVVEARKQYKADNWLAEHAKLDFFSDKDAIHKGQLYADAAVRGQQDRINKSFEYAKQLGIEDITEEDWNSELEFANDVFALANSRITEELAKQRGLEKGTDRYNSYVSLLNYYRNRHQDALIRSNAQQLAAMKVELDSKDDLENGVNSYVAALGLSGDENISRARLYVQTAANMNAKKEAYELVISELDAANDDMSELADKFGITYNRNDLNTTRAAVRKQYKEFMQEYDTWYNGTKNVFKDKNDLTTTLSALFQNAEYTKSRERVVKTLKAGIYTNVDLERAAKDYQALAVDIENPVQLEYTETGDAKKDAEAKRMIELTKKRNEEVRKNAKVQTERKLNKLERIAKDNQELEQTIQDNHRHIEEGEDSIPVTPTPAKSEIQPDPSRKGHKQLIRYFTNLRNTSDPKDRAGAILGIISNVTAGAKITELEKEELDSVIASLNLEGYTLELKIGDKWYEGSKGIVYFIDDPNLPEGQFVIDKIHKNRILKDGVLFRSGEIIVRLGIALSGIEIESKAFPKSNSVIESIRSRELQTLNEDPTSLPKNDKLVREIRREIVSKYGERGSKILDRILANPTGFLSKEGREVSRMIEELTPINYSEIETGINEKRKEISEARKLIIVTDVKPAGRRPPSNLAKQEARNEQRRKIGAPEAKFTAEELDMQPTTEWNAENRYGKNYLTTQEVRDAALTAVEAEIGQIMTAAYPGTSWKYNGPRKPYFALLDVDAILELAETDDSLLQDGMIEVTTGYDAEGKPITGTVAVNHAFSRAAKAKISAPLKNVLQAIADLNDIMSQYEEAVSNIDIESIDKLTLGMLAAQANVKDAVEAYEQSKARAEEQKIDLDKLDTRLERGHRLQQIGSAEYAELSTKPDFITASTFTLEIRGGKPYIIINYKGTVIPMLITRNLDGGIADPKFDALFTKIQEYIKLLQKDSSLEIVPIEFDRTQGERVRGELKNLTDSTFWLNSKDPYLITQDNVVITVGTGSQSRRGDITVDQATTSRGGLYWHVQLNRPETSRKVMQTIKLVPARLGEFNGLSDLVLDLFTQLNKLFYTTKSGIETPFSPQQLLDFIVFNGTGTATTAAQQQNLDASTFLNLTNKKLLISANGTLIIGNSEYNLTDLQSNAAVRNQAIEQLNQFNFRISEDNLQDVWGSDTMRPGIFKGLRSWFELHPATEKLTIVPGAVEFTRDMVGLGSDPKHIKGISALGYYISNGLIKTDLDHLENCRLYFKDAVLRKKEDKPIEQEIKDVAEDKPVDKGINPWDELFGGFAPFTVDDKSKQEERTQDEIDLAKAFLRRVVGLTDDQVGVANAIITATKAGLYVLGATRIDSITLSRTMPKGVEYHEAWHRVSNLLMEPKKRKKLFDRMKKKYGENLTDQELDEILAERFRAFLLGIIEEVDYETTNWFKRVYNFIKTLVKAGDFGLAIIYYNINRGKYANIKPSEESIARFKELYKEGYIPFKIRGKEFKHIPNQRVLDDVVTSLAYYLFNPPYKITDADGNTRVTVMQITDYSNIDLLPFDHMWSWIKTNAVTNPVFKELEENAELVQKLLSDKLKSYQVKGVDATAEQDQESVDGDGAAPMNIDDYTKANYEIDPYSNAAAEVKFFMSTVPQIVLSEDRRGFTTNKSIIGVPVFVNPRSVWNIVLNDLHHVATQQQLIDEVEKLAQYNPFYMGVLSRLNLLIEKTKSSDKATRTAAEATMTKIITTIHSHKNYFLTVKAVTRNNTHNLSIVDNAVDVRGRAYPAMWSQSLTINGGPLMYDEKNNLIFTKNGRHQILIAIKRYNDIVRAIQNNGKLVENGVTYDLHESHNQLRIKMLLVDILSRVGITIDTGTIDQMLKKSEYGIDAAPYQKLANFIHNNTSVQGGMRSIFTRLDALLKVSDNANQFTIYNNKEQVLVNTKDIWVSSGFAKELANMFVAYHNNHDNMMSIGADSAMLYASSQNNFSSDRVDELNEGGQIWDDFGSIPYTSSSYVLDRLRKGDKLTIETFVNFKTNNSGDTGSDYHDITDLEDYVSKMTMVLGDRLLFPTIADKKTYHVLAGIPLFHERFKRHTSNEFYKRFVQFGDSTISQFLKYAYSDLASVEQCLNQLDPNHPDYIQPEQRIKNYHTDNKYETEDSVTGEKKKHIVEPNGTRFRFLTGIYVIDETGEQRYINFNDPKKSSKENIETAKQYFFNAPVETQILYMNTILNHRLNEELAYAASIGLIEGNTETTKTIKNKLLDDRVLSGRKAEYERMGVDNAELLAIVDIIADYMVNSIISVNEVERLFSGDPAFYKVLYDENGPIDVSVDKIKRSTALTSTGLNNRLDFEDFNSDYTCAELKDFEIQSRQYDEQLVPMFTDSALRETVKQLHGKEATLHEDGTDKTLDELKQEFPDALDLAKVKAKSEVGGYSSRINVADAAVYVTPEFYAKMMRAIGEWSPEIEEAYRILTKPANDAERNWESVAKAYHKVMKASLRPLKYMAFGLRILRGKDGNAQLAVPYFNKMALFPLFESVATGDMRRLYDRMTETDNEIDMVLFESAVKVGSKNPISFKEDLHKFVTYKLNMKYLRLQLSTSPHEEDHQMAGTQMLKVALANLDLLGNYGFGDQKIKGQDIRDNIFNAMNKLSDIGRERLAERLLNEDGSLSIEKLSKMLIEDLESQGADNNMLDGVQYENGKLSVSLGATSGNNWIESRILSMINKETIDVILPGGSFIQRSAFGLASDNIIQDSMVNDGKALKMIDETDGSMHAVISITMFKHVIPRYNKMTFTEARKWLLDHNIIGLNSEPQAIGYRIPTQAQSSISPLKFMDVLPENMADTIILPEEFTKQTGSDFDIDKLFVSRYAYDKQGNKIKFDPKLGFDGNSEDAIKNFMIENYLKVLTTTEITNQLKGSIDDATDTVKGIHKRLIKAREKDGSNNVETFQQWMPLYQETKKSEYTKGKAGIGPFALNNAHHVLTQLMKVRFKDNDFTRAMNFIDVFKQYDDDGSGRRVMDWLSAMINAFVDIAKDPYIVDMNVNAYTYNMTSFLLRMGKGEQTFYFLNQPVIREIADAVLKVRGKYGKLIGKTLREIEEAVTNAILDRYGIDENVRKVHKSILKDPKLLAQLLSDIFNGTLELRLFGKDGAFNQAQIWLAWQAFKPYADDLANLVKYSKVDTKKMGKSFIEQFLYEKGMNDLPNNSTLNKQSILDFYNNTFILHKMLNSVVFGRDTFAGQLLRTSPSFLTQLNEILFKMGREKTTMTDQVNPLVRAMEQSIKAEFFNQFIADNNINLTEMFHSKTNTLAKRLIRLSLDIKQRKYPELLAPDGTIANELLNYLIPNTVKTEDKFVEPDYIDTRTMFDQDAIVKNQIIQGWEELLESPREDIRELARDLIVYAFITSADSKNMNSFFKFVPASWKKSSGYSDFIQNKIDNNESIVNNIEDLFLNNWRNELLVPTVEMPTMGIKSKNPVIGETVKPYIIFAGEDIKANSYREIFREGIGHLKAPIYPPYVKVQYDSNSKDPRSYMVYRLIGHKRQKRELIPIYIAVNKKGYDWKGHKMFEYGTGNSINMFNWGPIGITEADTRNGNLARMIYKKRFADNASANKQIQNAYFSNFVKYEPLDQFGNYYKMDREEVDAQISETVNIYYASNENAELSNFAERPFTTADGTTYRNVESAFQAAKLAFAGINDNNKLIADKLRTSTGSEARKLGRLITELDTKLWDANSSVIMKDLIKASFELNPDALKALLATGNSTLTHNLDNSKWKTEFPEVRDELRLEQSDKLDDGDLKRIQYTRTSEQKPFTLFEGLRQIRIKVPGTNITVDRAKQLITQLREAESKSNEITDTIEFEILGTIYDDWNEREAVAKLLKDKQFKLDVELMFGGYLRIHPTLDEIDFEQLSKNWNLSEMLEKIILESGSFIKEDPNQLNLFDDSEFSDEAMKHCKK